MINKCDLDSQLQKLQKQLIIHKINENQVYKSPKRKNANPKIRLSMDDTTQIRQIERSNLLNKNYKMEIDMKFDLNKEPVIETTQQFLQQYYKPKQQNFTVEREQIVNNFFSKDNSPTTSKKKRRISRNKQIKVRTIASPQNQQENQKQLYIANEKRTRFVAQVLECCPQVREQVSFEIYFINKQIESDLIQ